MENFLIFSYFKTNFFFLVNISNSEFLHEANISSNIINDQIVNAETPQPNNNQIAQNLLEVNNIFDDVFFKEWLFDMVITINIWHVFLLTAISCYLYNVSPVYLIIILSVFDVYDLIFLIRRVINNK